MTPIQKRPPMFLWESKPWCHGLWKRLSGVIRSWHFLTASKEWLLAAMSRNPSLIRPVPYKCGCLKSEAHRSTFQAISPFQIRVYLKWLNKTSGKTSSFYCANLRKWKSVRTRCIVPYKSDIFIFWSGYSPHRLVPYRCGITVMSCITI